MPLKAIFAIAMTLTAALSAAAYANATLSDAHSLPGERQEAAPIYERLELQNESLNTAPYGEADLPAALDQARSKANRSPAIDRPAIDVEPVDFEETYEDIILLRQSAAELDLEHYEAIEEE